MLHLEEDSKGGESELMPKVKLNAKGKVRTNQVRKRKKKTNKGTPNAEDEAAFAARVNAEQAMAAEGDRKGEAETTGGGCGRAGDITTAAACQPQVENISTTAPSSPEAASLMLRASAPAFVPPAAGLYNEEKKNEADTALLKKGDDAARALYLDYPQQKHPRDNPSGVGGGLLLYGGLSSYGLLPASSSPPRSSLHGGMAVSRSSRSASGDNTGASTPHSMDGSLDSSVGLFGLEDYLQSSLSPRLTQEVFGFDGTDGSFGNVDGNEVSVAGSVGGGESATGIDAAAPPLPSFEHARQYHGGGYGGYGHGRGGGGGSTQWPRKKLWGERGIIGGGNSSTDAWPLLSPSVPQSHTPPNQLPSSSSSSSTAGSQPTAWSKLLDNTDANSHRHSNNILPSSSQNGYRAGTLVPPAPPPSYSLSSSSSSPPPTTTLTMPTQQLSDGIMSGNGNDNTADLLHPSPPLLKRIPSTPPLVPLSLLRAQHSPPLPPPPPSPPSLSPQTSTTLLEADLANLRAEAVERARWKCWVVEAAEAERRRRVHQLEELQQEEDDEIQKRRAWAAAAIEEEHRHRTQEQFIAAMTNSMWFNNQFVSHATNGQAWDRYEIVCPYAHAGCATVCPRAELDAHLRSCGFAQGVAQREVEAMRGSIQDYQTPDADAGSGDASTLPSAASSSTSPLCAYSYEVVCPYSCMGCPHVCGRQELEAHLEVCAHRGPSAAEEECERHRVQATAMQQQEEERWRRVLEDRGRHHAFAAAAAAQSQYRTQHSPNGSNSPHQQQQQATSAASKISSSSSSNLGEATEAGEAGRRRGSSSSDSSKEDVGGGRRRGSATAVFAESLKKEGEGSDQGDQDIAVAAVTSNSRGKGKEGDDEGDYGDNTAGEPDERKEAGEKDKKEDSFLDYSIKTRAEDDGCVQENSVANAQDYVLALSLLAAAGAAAPSTAIEVSVPEVPPLSTEAAKRARSGSTSSGSGEGVGRVAEEEEDIYDEDSSSLNSLSQQQQQKQQCNLQNSPPLNSGSRKTTDSSIGGRVSSNGVTLNHCQIKGKEKSDNSRQQQQQQGQPLLCPEAREAYTDTAISLPSSANEAALTAEILRLAAECEVAAARRQKGHAKILARLQGVIDGLWSDGVATVYGSVATGLSLGDDMSDLDVVVCWDQQQRQQKQQQQQQQQQQQLLLQGKQAKNCSSTDENTSDEHNTNSSSTESSISSKGSNGNSGATSGRFQSPCYSVHLLAALLRSKGRDWVRVRKVIDRGRIPIIKAEAAMKISSDGGDEDDNDSNDNDDGNLSSNSNGDGDSSNDSPAEGAAEEEAASGRSPSSSSLHPTQWPPEGCVLVAVDLTIHTPSHTGVTSTAFVKELVGTQEVGLVGGGGVQKGGAPRSGGLPCLRPLVMVVKKLLKTHGLGDPYHGGCSSYAVVLMLTFFLLQRAQRSQTLKLNESAAAAAGITTADTPPLLPSQAGRRLPQRSPSLSPASSPSPKPSIKLSSTPSLSPPALSQRKFPQGHRSLSPKRENTGGARLQRNRCNIHSTTTAAAATSSATAANPPPPVDDAACWPPLNASAAVATRDGEADADAALVASSSKNASHAAPRETDAGEETKEARATREASIEKARATASAATATRAKMTGTGACVDEANDSNVTAVCAPPTLSSASASESAPTASTSSSRWSSPYLAIAARTAAAAHSPQAATMGGVAFGSAYAATAQTPNAAAVADNGSSSSSSVSTVGSSDRGGKGMPGGRTEQVRSFVPYSSSSVTTSSLLYSSSAVPTAAAVELLAPPPMHVLASTSADIMGSPRVEQQQASSSSSSSSSLLSSSLEFPPPTSLSNTVITTNTEAISETAPLSQLQLTNQTSEEVRDGSSSSSSGGGSRSLSRKRTKPDRSWMVPRQRLSSLDEGEEEEREPSSSRSGGASQEALPSTSTSSSAHDLATSAQTVAHIPPLLLSPPPASSSSSSPTASSTAALTATQAVSVSSETFLASVGRRKASLVLLYALPVTTTATTTAAATAAKTATSVGTSTVPAAPPTRSLEEQTASLSKRGPDQSQQRLGKDAGDDGVAAAASAAAAAALAASLAAVAPRSSSSFRQLQPHSSSSPSPGNLTQSPPLPPPSSSPSHRRRHHRQEGDEKGEDELEEELEDNLGKMLVDFLQFWGSVFEGGREGFSVRNGGFRFSVLGGDLSKGGPPRHPQASDPVVIEDPVHVISNVGRSSYRFQDVQRLFASTHATLAGRLRLLPSQHKQPSQQQIPASPKGGNLPTPLTYERVKADLETTTQNNTVSVIVAQRAEISPSAKPFPRWERVGGGDEEGGVGKAVNLARGVSITTVEADTEPSSVSHFPLLGEIFTGF